MAWRKAMLCACKASKGAAALEIAAFHCVCISTNAFSPKCPASRQRSPNWCRIRLNPFQSPSRAVRFAAAHVLISSISAKRCALLSADSVRTLFSQPSTTLCASLQASSKRFHMAWLGVPPWSVCFHCSRKARSCSCILRPPMAWPSGRLSKPSACATKASRNWSARQRCQPSSSPAAANAAWAKFSNLSSITRPNSFSAWRKAPAAPALALPWPSEISSSKVVSAARTLSVACARTWGSTLGFAGLATASIGIPRATRNSSAQTKTGGKAADASAAAATASAKAP